MNELYFIQTAIIYNSIMAFFIVLKNYIKHYTPRSDKELALNVLKIS